MDQVVFKFFGWLITIDWIIMGLLLLAIIFLSLKWWKGGRRLVIALSALIFVTAILPTGPKILCFLEQRFPQPETISSDVKGIILLGGSFDLSVTANRGFPCYNQVGGRIIDFLELAHKYPHLQVVFSGGGPINNPLANEAANTKRVLEGVGFDMNRVSFETKSKTTIENAKNSYELIKPKSGEKWLLVTSAYHMPRSMGLFRKAGWEVIAYPVDYHVPKVVSWLNFGTSFAQGFLSWSTGIREIGGLSANYLAGRSDTWIPSPEDR
jgi:uncharacterized SAM-binding protein YcdF (DUF218 family)